MEQKTQLFNGQNLDNWLPRTGCDHAWEAVASIGLRDGETTRLFAQPGSGILYNGLAGVTSDIYTAGEFGDCRLHVEFCVPKDSNSGVYFLGRYEVQILDSFGKAELSFGTCGGIYARWIDGEHYEGSPPRVNVSLPPGEWQTYDISFRAPRFSIDGTKTEKARFIEWSGMARSCSRMWKLEGRPVRRCSKTKKPRDP